MSTHRSSNPSNNEDIAELLHHAILRGDQDARLQAQERLGEVVHGWLHHHPNKEAAYRLDSEEHYVAAAFERFWRLTSKQQLQFSTLVAALPYLRVSLQGAILDTLRAASRPGAASLPQPTFPKELLMEDAASGLEVWECLMRVLPDLREQRLAYLLFHCGLRPQEIVHHCSQEFSDVCEIQRLRRTILERLSRNEDLLQWLSTRPTGSVSF